MFDAPAHLARLIEELEKDIAQNPDPRGIHLGTLKAAYSAMLAGTEALMPTAKVREGSKKEQFRAHTAQLIEKNGGRVHRKEVIVYMDAFGMFPGTADLDRDVSKYLSTDGTFAPDGDGYWKRKPKGD